MDAGTLAALIGGITALVTAIGGVIAIVRHVNGPAHQDPPQAVQPKL
jgi:hypothetical protein